ncbi:MAG: carboxypeptidase regulatory-like domain-containing protein [Pyrinomonadaceae bacterium]
MRWLFIATVFASVMLSAGNALACSCLESAPCQAYGEASAVFVGTVIDSRVITTKRDKYERSKRAVRLSVDTPFRGVTGSEVELTTGMGGGDCGFGFVLNKQYLVYAYENKGKLSTGICSRTRSISSAAEDLSYIHGLAKAKPGATISGKVVRNRRSKNGGDENLPLAGTKVTIEGQAKKNIKTDMKGQFRIEGLPAGSYVVKVSVPEGLHMSGAHEQKVEVTDHGCAVVDFWLEPIRKPTSLNFRPWTEPQI